MMDPQPQVLIWKGIKSELHVRKAYESDPAGGALLAGLFW